MIPRVVLLCAALCLLRQGQAQRISVESGNCHVLDDPVVLDFSGSANSNEFVAVVSTADIGDTDQRPLTTIRPDQLTSWTWKCGVRPCSTREGSVRLTTTIPVGSYVAVLLTASNRSGEPLPVLSQSRVFRVEATSCADREPVVPLDHRRPINGVVTADSTMSDVPSLRLSQSTYTAGDTITVHWTNHVDAENDDFFAVYPASVSPDRLRDGILWTWTCNHQQGNDGCDRIPAPSGTVQLDATSVWNADSEWPLTPGTVYRVYLIRNLKTPFWEPLAVSERFRVVAPPSTSSTRDDDTVARPETASALPVSSVTRGSVRADRSVIPFGQAFTIHFSNTDLAREDDWIGIYRSSAPSDRLGVPLLWKWTCDRQGDECSTSRVTGQVRISQSAVDEDADGRVWPLAPGRYTAYLLRNTRSPFWQVIEQSTSFLIQRNAPPTDNVVEEAPQPVPQPVPVPQPIPVPEPVPVPQPVPIPQPVSVPAPMPNDVALAGVRAERISFLPSESIWIEFDHVSSAALADDWIGIYHISFPSHQLEDALLWKWTCNSDLLCPSPTVAGRVRLDAFSGWTATSPAWPLAPGQYRAFLLRNEKTDAGFWEVLDESPPFRVVAGDDATAAPSTPFSIADTTTSSIPESIVDTTTSSIPVLSAEMESTLAFQDIAAARRSIEGMIREDADLAPKFLRLIFHDCIGGCDGTCRRRSVMWQHRELMSFQLWFFF